MCDHDWSILIMCVYLISIDKILHSHKNYILYSIITHFSLVFSEIPTWDSDMVFWDVLGVKTRLAIAGWCWMFLPPHGKFIGNLSHPPGLYIPHLALQPLVVHVHHLNIRDAWRNHNLGEIIGEMIGLLISNSEVDLKILKNWITQAKLEAWHSSSRLLKVVKLLWKVSNGIIPPDIAQVTCCLLNTSIPAAQPWNRKNKTRRHARLFMFSARFPMAWSWSLRNLAVFRDLPWTGPSFPTCWVHFPSPLHLIVGILSCHLHLTCNFTSC